MTAIPGHLLDIAALADRTPGREGRTLAVTTARTILACLPADPPHEIAWRRAQVAAEANATAGPPRTDTRRARATRPHGES